jgi:hypothetical protein
MRVDTANMTPVIFQIVDSGNQLWARRRSRPATQRCECAMALGLCPSAKDWASGNGLTPRTSQ